MLLVVFTDLDGTLLDRDNYRFEAARPALELLASRGIPVVFCTSKTRAETEVWRARLDNRHPFITENGGAIFVPQGYFPFALPGASPRGAYDVAEFGDPYHDLVAVLAAAACNTGVEVRGFHQMSAEEVARRCGLPLELASLARQREYDEPFEVLDPGRAPALLDEIQRAGKRWTRGGRFYHVTGNNDKAEAVRVLTDAYRRLSRELTTVGLGDGLNDAEFLRAVDVPFLIRSRDSAELLARVPAGRLTQGAGPAGWNEAILDVVPRILGK